MKRRPAIIDTNVVVAGLLAGDPDAPAACVLDGMIRGHFPFVLSVALLAEYREVLMRAPILERHGLTEEEIDGLLTGIAANAIVREADFSGAAPDPPDPGNQLVWHLLAGVTGAVVVTGDEELSDDPPAGAAAVLPAAFVEGLFRSKNES